jgi:hypothetical protein|tara:strand:+ start:67 stop:240 length:174 start_codon:yes stop_codon:yes gene_type:complete
MLLNRNTRVGKSQNIIRLIVVILILFVAVIFISKIDFPSPNQTIEKILPNENFKIVK